MDRAQGPTSGPFLSKPSWDPHPTHKVTLRAPMAIAARPRPPWRTVTTLNEQRYSTTHNGSIHIDIRPYLWCVCVERPLTRCLWTRGPHAVQLHVYSRQDRGVRMKRTARMHVVDRCGMHAQRRGGMGAHEVHGSHPTAPAELMPAHACSMPDVTDQRMYHSSTSKGHMTRFRGKGTPKPHWNCTQTPKSATV